MICWLWICLYFCGYILCLRVHNHTSMEECCQYLCSFLFPSVLIWKISKRLVLINDSSSFTDNIILETIVVKFFFPGWRLNIQAWTWFPFCALKGCKWSFGSGRWVKGILAGVLVLFVLQYSVCALSGLYFVLSLIQSYLFFSTFWQGLAQQDFSHLGQRFCFWGFLRMNQHELFKLDISEEADEYELPQ